MISVTLVFNDHFVLFKGGTEEEEAQMSLSGSNTYKYNHICIQMF